VLSKTILSSALMLTLAACGGNEPASPISPAGHVDHARVAPAGLDAITSTKLQTLLTLRALNRHASVADVIDIVSREFLDTPYQGGMLVGSPDAPERLVIDFRGLDCFTYLDYVEAIRRTSATQSFTDSLISTRYVDGQVGFATRRHFFTDWSDRIPVLADDITATLSAHAVSVDKQLNLKADGGTYLPGLPVRARTVVYIPGEYVDAHVVGQLRSGDFIGIYAKTEGLDVTHVGFFIQTSAEPVFRNASSRQANMSVVDTPFLDYVRDTPGIVVLRTKA
jgi:N-acetylmuramoyl-L-alanine amidase-like